MADSPLFDKYGNTIRDGSVIFKEGEAGDRMYIIQSGVVVISKVIDSHEHKLAELGKGEFFGEMAIVSNVMRSATATASGTVELLAFDRQGFESMIAKNSKIAMSVIDKLSRRLMNANAQIQQLTRTNTRSMIGLNLYNRFMECETAEKKLTFSRAVESIALELEVPPAVVSETLFGFDRAGVCKIDGNAIVLHDKKRLVALTGTDE